jgi:4-amino-4-deoxy-L-arabinose transferase-like glycosyltransferase
MTDVSNRSSPARPEANANAIARALAALFALAMVVLWFAVLDYRKLVEPDEGRYAEVAREMLVTGDLVTPRLNGFKHFTKPPLQYWMTAAAYRLFGANEWTARLWSALAGMLGLFAVLFTMRSLFSPAAGAASAAVLASSLYYVLFAQVATIDMGLTLFVTLAMCALMLGLDARAESAAERGWMLGAWCAMGLALLSKGLIGVVIPLMSVALYASVHRQWQLWRRLHPLKGMCLMLAIAAPWFIAVSLRNPEFPRFFFLEEHFARYTSTVHRREQPVWFFFPLLLAAMLPWTWLVLAGLRSAWRTTGNTTAFQPGRFLVVWAASIVLFFTFSKAKMPAYVLPAIPALAMLAGARLADLDARALLWRVLPLLVLLGVAMLSAGLILPRALAGDPYRILYERYALWLFAAAATVLGAAGWIALARPARLPLTGCAALGTLLAIQICILGFESLSPLRSSHALASEIQTRLAPGTKVFMVGASYLTLPFYLDRTVLLAQETGQMAFGVRLEPHRALLESHQLRDAWIGAGHALALMHTRNYLDARAAGLPMKVLCRDRKRVLVIKPTGASNGASEQATPDCVLQALRN